eukprot:2295022-Prymnesium_polylepis.1
MGAMRCLIASTHAAHSASSVHPSPPNRLASVNKSSMFAFRANHAGGTFDCWTRFGSPSLLVSSLSSSLQLPRPLEL